MQTSYNENSIRLHGRVCAPPTPSHTSHGEVYYIFPLCVTRLSGAEDVLNVTISVTQLSQLPAPLTGEVTVLGEVRTFNNKSGIGSRLIISVFAREILAETGKDENSLFLSGTICKPPIYRKTPLNRDICDLMLAINRKYGRTDYLPCITWGQLAHRCAKLGVGAQIRLDGRLQSRKYTKKIGAQSEERVAYEVSVMQLEPLDLACDLPVSL